MIQLSRLASALLLAAAQAHATEATAPPQIQVSGSRADQRQHDTTASIVVPHGDLVRNGDQSLADALKRLPGISIGNTSAPGGGLQLRGLGQGYTQILLNGEPVPTGFQLDAIALETVERVEIMRSTTAEYSNQAVAGAINIILRKASARDQHTLSASLARQAGMDTPALSWQLAEQHQGYTLSLAATLTRKRLSKPVSDWEQLVAGSRTTLLRHTAQSETRTTDTLSLSPRVVWQLQGGDTLSWQSYVNLRRADHSTQAEESTLLGDSSSFPRNRSRFIANFLTVRSDLNWRRTLDGGAELESKIGISTQRRSGIFDFEGRSSSDQPLGRHHVDSAPAETTVTAGATWRLPVNDRHALAAGVDASHALRREDRNETLFAADGAPAGRNNADYRAQVDRLAVFAQDEWTISARSSLYLGLRYESLITDSRADASNALPRVDARAGVWSPSLQLRLAPTPQDVLRLALNRSYKAPDLSKLVPRRYTNDNNNNPTNPDQQGNPQLRPELAWGLDTAWEHYLGEGALFSISAYARRIQDVTQTRLFQQDGVWLASPFNDGDASAHGLELEAKLPLRRLLAQAPALDLRANLARNWSHVARVPGPYNRLENQTPLTANLGADYRISAALTVGANLNYQAGGTARGAAATYEDSNARRELDLYGQWKRGANWQARLSLSGLLARSAQELNAYNDAASLHTRRSSAPASPTIRLQLERLW